jgi:uncharacterized protein YndB with AHSA1/START domain
MSGPTTSTRGYRAGTVIDADADAVFGLLTTPARLPEWNGAIARVVDAPEHLTNGAQWLVEFKAMGQSWRSRSTVLEVDSAGHNFVYRSQTDDGNPSYADWSWHVADAPGGCEVTVSYALHPATFWRRVLLVKIRARQLRRRELPSSLQALASLATSVP